MGSWWLGPWQSYLARQLGYGVHGGVEAAVHAARKYMQNLPSEHAMLKLDFRNAFNSVRRDKVLEAVRDLAPNIYPLVHSSYSTSLTLLWGDKVIQYQEGMQQGDSLGPLLFVWPLIATVSSFSLLCV